MDPYTITIARGAYVVLEASEPTAYRLQEPGGQVITLPCEDSSIELTSEALEALFAAQDAKVFLAEKAAVRGLAKARRAALIAAGFSYAGKTIQTRDEADIANINSAALAALSLPTFATDWITADNSMLPLDQTGMLIMQGTMVATGNAIFTAYAAIAAQIEAAADLDTLNAIADTAANFAP